MSLSIDDDWLKPAEDQRDAGPSSSVTGGKKKKNHKIKGLMVPKFWVP